MKTAAAYYLLIFYSIALFKPVLPFLSDYLAHSFSQAHHIATVHEKHGASHVHNEIAASATENDDQQNTPTTKFSEPFPFI